MMVAVTVQLAMKIPFILSLSMDVFNDCYRRGWGSVTNSYNTYFTLHETDRWEHKYNPLLDFYLCIVLGIKNNRNVTNKLKDYEKNSVTISVGINQGEIPTSQQSANPVSTISTNSSYCTNRFSTYQNARINVVIENAGY